MRDRNPTWKTGRRAGTTDQIYPARPIGFTFLLFSPFLFYAHLPELATGRAALRPSHFTISYFFYRRCRFIRPIIPSPNEPTGFAIFSDFSAPCRCTQPVSPSVSGRSCFSAPAGLYRQLARRPMNPPWSHRFINFLPILAPHQEYAVI